MRSCDDGHVQLIYEEDENCPACELMDANQELEITIDELEDEIEELKEKSEDDKIDAALQDMKSMLKARD